MIWRIWRRVMSQRFAPMGYSALDFTNAAAAAMDGRLGALDWPQVFALEDGPQVVKDLHAGRVDRDFAVFSFSEPD